MTFSEFLRKEYCNIAPVAASAPHLYSLWIKGMPPEHWIDLATRWHKEETDRLLRNISSIDKELLDMKKDEVKRMSDGVSSMEEFQRKYFPDLVGKECPYCGTFLESRGK